MSFNPLNRSYHRKSGTYYCLGPRKGILNSEAWSPNCFATWEDADKYRGGAAPLPSFAPAPSDTTVDSTSSSSPPSTPSLLPAPPLSLSAVSPSALEVEEKDNNEATELESKNNDEPDDDGEEKQPSPSLSAGNAWKSIISQTKHYYTVEWHDGTQTMVHKKTFGTGGLSPDEFRQDVLPLMSRTTDTSAELKDKEKARAKRWRQNKRSRETRVFVNHEQHCTGCGEVARTTDRSGVVLCWACDSEREFGCSRASKVVDHGELRPSPVVVLTVSHDQDLVRSFNDRVDTPGVAGQAADVVVVCYHSKPTGVPLSSQQHADVITSAVLQTPTPPTFVLVLTCWTLEQVGALQQMATLVCPGTTFIVFQDPLLDAYQRFADSIRHITDTIAFPQAKPLRFLAALSQARPDTRMYQSCSSNLRWSGPMMIRTGGINGEVCPGCGGSYDGGGRWKKGVSGVRREMCKNRAEGCVDRLTA